MRVGWGSGGVGWVWGCVSLFIHLSFRKDTSVFLRLYLSLFHTHISLPSLPSFSVGPSLFLSFSFHFLSPSLSLSLSLSSSLSLSLPPAALPDSLVECVRGKGAEIADFPQQVASFLLKHHSSVQIKVLVLGSLHQNRLLLLPGRLLTRTGISSEIASDSVVVPLSFLLPLSAESILHTFGHCSDTLLCWFGTLVIW